MSRVIVLMSGVMQSLNNSVSNDALFKINQDEYSRLSRNASVGVDGYVLVFSIISRQSFDRIKQINESLLSALGDAVDIPRVLVGSICDLNEQRQVSHKVSAIWNYSFLHDIS